MSSAMDAVLEFARDMGVNDALVMQSHALHLEAESGVAVVVQESPGAHDCDWLVYAAAPLPFDGYGVMQRTLLYAHDSRGGPWQVQVAVSVLPPEKRLVFSLRLKPQEVTVQRLHLAVACLYRWLDKFDTRGWNDL